VAAEIAAALGEHQSRGIWPAMHRDQDRGLGRASGGLNPGGFRRAQEQGAEIGVRGGQG
jgi:hypothetical protein